MSEINFLTHRQKKLDKQQKQDLKILKFAGIFFGGVMLIFMITMGVMFYLKFRLNNLNQQIVQLEQSILGQEDVEKSIVLAYEKLEVIEELFDIRHDKQAAIAYFSNLFGSNVLIKDINYESDTKILSLIVETSSIFEFDEVIAKLATDEVKEKFNNINQNDLRRNADAEYTVMLTMNLK
jgi:hypothetical protein